MTTQIACALTERINAIRHTVAELLTPEAQHGLADVSRACPGELETVLGAFYLIVCEETLRDVAALVERYRNDLAASGADAAVMYANPTREKSAGSR